MLAGSGSKKIAHGERLTGLRFMAFQDEIAREIRLVEAAEEEPEAIENRGF